MNQASEQFVAFNEQLAQLTSASLPVEYGLRLIAQDLRRGKLSRQITELADQLEHGVPLAEAFAKNGNAFPPIYVRLIEAGVRSNNLSGMLMNLGRHLELMRRLRDSMWRTLAYPLIVLVFLAVILAVISHFLFPQFAVILSGYSKTNLDWYWFASRAEERSPPNPAWLIAIIFTAGKVLPILLLLFVCAVVSFPFVLRRMSRSDGSVERFTLRVPLIGPILVKSMIARWCDATSVAIGAGIDLPGAMRLASDAVHSPALSADSDRLAAQIESGRTIGERLGEKYAVLPATVPAAIQVGIASSSLPATLHSLSDMYERQASLRVENLPAILSPILLGLIAVIVCLAVIGLTLPVVQLLEFYMRMFK